MLRRLVAGLGALCSLGGLIALLLGFPFGIVIMIGGGAVLAGTLYERVQYKPALTAKPGPGWTRTGERFYDEQSGKLLTVYIQPETGERSYVEE